MYHHCFFLIIIIISFWLCHTAHEILVLSSRIEPRPPAMEAQSFNSWMARKVSWMNTVRKLHLSFLLAFWPQIVVYVSWLVRIYVSRIICYLQSVSEGKCISPWNTSLACLFLRCKDPAGCSGSPCRAHSAQMGWRGSSFQEKALLTQRREIAERGLSCLLLVIQSLGRVRLFVTPWTAARQASLSITVSWSLFKPMSIELVMTSIQPSHSLSSPSPPALKLSQNQGLFQWVVSLHQVANRITSITPYFNTSEERVLPVVADGTFNLCLQCLVLCVPSLSCGFPHEQWDLGDCSWQKREKLSFSLEQWDSWLLP